MARTMGSLDGAAKQRRSNQQATEALRDRSEYARLSGVAREASRAAARSEETRARREALGLDGPGSVRERRRAKRAAIVPAADAPSSAPGPEHVGRAPSL